MISENYPKMYCSEPLENIENYDLAVADKEHLWDCHHRNEICLANQSRLDRGITSKEQLIADGMYWHRPASELIFIRRDEHTRLHNLNQSQETRMTRTLANTNNPLRLRPVEMTRLSDGTTKTFPSLTEAGKWLRENGYPRATIGNVQWCCAGKHKFAYGAKWRYL